MADGPDFVKKLAERLYLLLFLLGVLFYFAWSLVYDTWDITKAENMGVYALAILMVGFGITGFFLYREPAKTAAKVGKP